MSLHKTIPALLLAALLAACGGGEPGTIGGADDDGAQAPAQQGPRVVSATGEVVPTRESTLAFRASGQLVELNVEVGDVVEEGDLIARLDTIILDAQIEQAEAGLEVAEANLEKARAGARDPEIAEQEANLAAAGANTGVAAGQVNDLLSGPSEAEIAVAQAQVQGAFITYWNARAERDYLQQVVNNPETLEQELFYTQDLVDDATEDLNTAQRDLEVAQAQLDQLLSGANPDQVQAARAEAAAAGADYQAAQAQLDLTAKGPTEEDIAVAQASVDQAEASLEQVRLLREQAVVRAPFDGTIAELFLLDSQYVSAGTPTVTVADLDTLQIETTDLNELDVAEISEGDTAIITFDALPGVELEGTIDRIAPKAEEGTGVNFTVVITVDDLPEAIRWGMTAFVDIPIEN